PTSRVRDPFPEDGGAGREETRDGGAGREGASETRSWRPRSDDPAARGYGVAARHIVDGVGGLLPLFVSLRRLLTGVLFDLFKCSSSMTVPNLTMISIAPVLENLLQCTVYNYVITIWLC
ncbi:unnamed protein product, partial [Urochloa humidicola]